MNLTRQTKHDREMPGVMQLPVVLPDSFLALQTTRADK